MRTFLGDKYLYITLVIGFGLAALWWYFFIYNKSSPIYGADKLRFEQRNESVAAGEVSSGLHGQVSIFDLRTGDCFEVDLPEGPGIIATVNRTPCEGEWQIRVNAALVVNLDADEDYPGGQYFDQLRPSMCPAGTTTILWPSMDSWNLGDRVWLCLEEFPR